MTTITKSQALEIILDMNDHVHNARRLDEQEWESAKNAIEGCSVQKQEISQETITGVFDYPQQRIADLRGRWMDVFGPGLTAQQEISERQNEWQTRDQALTDLQSRIDSLKMAGWEGAGADNYRQRIAELSAHVTEQKKLTAASCADLPWASNYMENVNTEYGAAMTAGGSAVASCPLPPANTSWPTADWWAVNKNAEQYDFTFFTRTAAVSNALCDLCNKLAAIQTKYPPLDAAGTPTVSATTDLGGPPPPSGPIGVCVAGPRQLDAPASGYN